MSDLLLEIGTEEIPAKFMPPAFSRVSKINERKIGRASSGL